MQYGKFWRGAESHSIYVAKRLLERCGKQPSSPFPALKVSKPPREGGRTHTARLPCVSTRRTP